MQHNHLMDTVAWMASPNYKERFMAEFVQTNERYVRLLSLLEDWKDGKLNFKPACPRSLLERQAEAMKAYLDILEARAYIEGIDDCKFF